MISLSTCFVLLSVKVGLRALAGSYNLNKHRFAAKHARSRAFPGHVKSRQRSVNMGREVKQMPNWLLQRTRRSRGSASKVLFRSRALANDVWAR